MREKGKFLKNPFRECRVFFSRWVTFLEKRKEEGSISLSLRHYIIMLGNCSRLFPPPFGTGEPDFLFQSRRNERAFLEPIIRIQNLRKVYRLGKEKVVALDNINLDIYKGQICCILGTSGSGKSTLLNQLAGLEKPSKGSVTIGKTNISVLSENKLAKFRQTNVGFIFQSYNLLATMTALENVAMPLMFRGVPKSIRTRRAKAILKKVGLGNRCGHRPNQMSGGQQQRVGIARAFAAKPKIIFADEPTGNLDSRTTIEVMELMVRMCRKDNQTLVLVTHDRELALYADRIVTLIDGKIVSDVENQCIVSMSEEEKHALSGGLPPMTEETEDALPSNLEEDAQEVLPEEGTLPPPKASPSPESPNEENNSLKETAHEQV